MKHILSSLAGSLLLFSCASRVEKHALYYDLESINHIPGGIDASLMRPGVYGDRQMIQDLGVFSQSAIVIAARTLLDSPLIVTWFDTNKVNHERPFPFHILPPLDTANQKYHLRFTFYPNDSVKIQARAVAKSDCRHTVRHGSTAEASFGPCIGDRGWINTLDSLNKGLLQPWKVPLDIPGWN